VAQAWVALAAREVQAALVAQAWVAQAAPAARGVQAARARVAQAVQAVWAARALEISKPLPYQGDCCFHTLCARPEKKDTELRTAPMRSEGQACSLTRKS